MIKTRLLFVIGILFILGLRPYTTIAQGVAINPDGSAAAESAMLDIKSTSKGLLIPRINITDLSSSAPVTSPEVSLLVYNTNTSTGLGYYYWTGTNWMRLTIAEDLDYVNGSGDATRVAFWTNTNTLGSNAKLFWDNTNERLGIGTDAPEFRFTVIDSTGIIADTTLFGATGVFENRSIDEWALGLAGISESSPGKGVGVGGLGGRCGVIGRCFQEGAGERIGIFGQLVDLNADYKYAILGIASGEGINCGIYGMASGGTYNWAGFFENDVCIKTKLIIGQVSTPQAQLQTTGSVRFQTLSGSGNRFVMTDANGNLLANSAASANIVSGSGTATQIAFWDGNNSLSSNANLFWDNTNEKMGIGTDAPEFRFTVIDSTGSNADPDEIEATGVFVNHSIEEWALGLIGVCESSPEKGAGVFGLGGKCGVIGSCFQEGAGQRIGIFGHFDELNADTKYAILGISTGEGINYGIYGKASGGTSNWAGFFENDVCIKTKLIIGQVSTPQAQLQTTGSVRFQTLSGSGNRFVMTDANGNLLANSAASANIVSGSGTATQIAFWDGNNSLSSNANLFWDNTNEKMGIGTDAPEFRFTVIDSTGINADPDEIEATGIFVNHSIEEWAFGLIGTCENSAGKGGGIGGIGGKCGVAGTCFQEGDGDRIGVFGHFDELNADNKFAILGISTGEGINYGIYGKASGGTSNWAGFFENDVCIQTKLVIGQVSTPQAQLQTTGSVRFQTLSGSGNRFVMTDANGNLSASNAAGSGIVSGSGTTNYIPKWTPDGNTLNNSQIFDNGTYVGIGTTNPQSQLHITEDMQIGTDTVNRNNILTFWAENGYESNLIMRETPDHGMGIRYNATDDKLYIDRYAGSTIPSPIITILRDSESIGIGTSAPSAQLHTTGTVRFQNYTSGTLQVDGSGNLSVGTGNSLFTAGNGLSWSGTTLNSVWTASGNNIYNNNSANVGIGCNAPIAKMQIDIESGAISDSSTMNKYNSLFFQTGISSGEGAGIAFTVFNSGTASQYSSITPGAAIVFERTNSNSKGKLHFKVKTSTTQDAALTKAITISDNANVGIQTTTPGSTLHVNGSMAGKVYTANSNATYTIPADAFCLIATATITENRTLTLPTLTSGETDGRVLYIRNAASSGSYGWNITAASGNSFSMTSGYTNPLAIGKGMVLVANGTIWYMIANSF